MESKEIKNSKEKRIKNLKPRCINIDCAFNSSLDPSDKRNICNHPNVFVDQESLEITIAICSEFRSKKDYKFEKPNKVIVLKDNSVTEIDVKGEDEAKAITVEPANIDNPEVTDKSIIREVTIPIVSNLTDDNIEREKPNIIDTGEESYDIPKLTNSPDWNLQILKRLYQPYLKRGVIISILIHAITIGFLYLFLSSDNSGDELSEEKRIVVVEDIETPKFNPPDMDVKEEPISPEQEIEDNNVNVRPQIKPKNIKPRIERPNITNETKDSNLTGNDTTFKRSGLNDSLLAKYMSDTNRYNIPDSLKRTFGENEIGLNIIYPAGWTVRDSRFFNPDEKEFSGVILNTDSLSEDPGAVQLTIIIDDDQRYFSKIKFKNTFTMLDSLSQALSAEPERFESRKEISYKFYIFAPTNKIYVDANVKDNFFEKYKPIVEAIVRSIRIAKNPSASNP